MIFDLSEDFSSSPVLKPKQDSWIHHCFRSGCIIILKVVLVPKV